MATESLEDLKAGWLRDPCWDIEKTVGFEAHRSDLLKFRQETEARWTHEREAREQSELEAQPAYWLKQITLELRALNRNMTRIEQAINRAAR